MNTDPSSIAEFSSILNLINAGGVTVILTGLVIMFVRGDIIPRGVYERLLRDTLTKISADIIASVTELLKDKSTYSDRQIRDLSERFNHIEECIERVREDTRNI
jgi:hypothetical protein